MNGKSVGMLCLVVLASGCATGPRDPALTELSGTMAGILERGDLSGIRADTRQKEALLHPDYGIRADYRAWIQDVRAYRLKLEQVQRYRDLPLVAELCDDPIRVPVLFEERSADLLAGQPGPETALSEAARLGHGVWGKWGTPPETRGAPSARFISALTNAAALVEGQALVAVSKEEREWLRQVIPWICRSGERFSASSKGSPYYGMEMMFSSEQGFTNLPAALNNADLLNGYLHALAGYPVPAGTGFACRVDFEAMGRAFAMLQPVLTTQALDALRDELKGKEPQRIETPYGPIIIGGSGPDRYADPDALAILDPGGDDDYVFLHPAESIGKRSVQVLIDFAGDDLYRTEGVGGPGAGLLGIGILVDRAGNDRYCQGLSPLFQPRAHSRASLVRPDSEGDKTALVPFSLLYGDPANTNAPGVDLDAGFAFGAGFLGIGVLVDETGDDIYLGQKFLFGCAFWRGVGVLHDVAGQDVYAAGLASLGAGINGAAGLMDDRGGDDHYQCLGLFQSGYSAGEEWDNGYMSSGIGFGSSWRAEARTNQVVRPTLGGGFGLAHDAAGSDCYIGSSFGLAASYAGGVGAVVDDAGDDTYFVKRGPAGDNHSGWSGNHALGNGCHRGVGFLLDRAGNDRYSASSLGGGTAWDRASGFLLDLGGDDAMIDLHGKHNVGNTGWGAAKGFAVSFHRNGKDIFERSSLGDAASWGDGYPGLGGNFSFFFHTGAEQAAYPKGYTNGTQRLGGVSWQKEADGLDYPRGIGIFWDD
jgi:hypothetical protein